MVGNSFLFISVAAWLLPSCGLTASAAILVVAIKNRRHLKTARENQHEAESLEYAKTGLIKLHLVSETEYVTKGQGVHTAYIVHRELMSDIPGITIKTNNEGTGNIFHSHTYGLYYFWKGRKYKGRRILTVHVIPASSKGSLPFWKQLMPLTVRYLKLAYSYADVVIAISPDVEETLKKLDVKSKIVRIYNPMLTEHWSRDISKRRRGRLVLGIGEKERVIMGVGQVQPRKGIEDFIEIAAMFPEIKFVWVGGRPWGIFTEGIARIDKKIRNAGNNLIFTGLLDISEMADMYAAADIFLFPSYQENCPLAPLEAAAAGLPVIFRDLAEYKSLYSSVYLKASDNEGFAKIVYNLLADRNYYENAMEISAKLLNEFDKEHIKCKLTELYRETLREYFDGN